MSSIVRVTSILGGRPHFAKVETVHRSMTGDPSCEHVIVQAWLGAEAEFPARATSGFVLPPPAAVIHCERLERMADALTSSLAHLAADIVIVYGDLPSTMAAAISARAAVVPIVHVESGHRSGWLGDSEECTRITVSHLATTRIAFNEMMVHNLSREGIPRDSIETFESPTIAALKRRLVILPGVLRHGGIVCFHRDENIGDSRRLSVLVANVLRVADAYDLCVLLHRNTRYMLNQAGLLERLRDHERIRLVDTMPYDAYVEFLAGASFVITDSSTMQDETAFLRIPSVVIRRATPRPVPRAAVVVPHLRSTKQLVAAVGEVLSRKEEGSDSAAFVAKGWDSGFVDVLRATLDRSVIERKRT